MAPILRGFTAERHRQPAMFHVKGRVISPDSVVLNGYAVTTGVQLRPLHSPDPTILVLEVVLDVARRPTANPAHGHRAILVSFHEPSLTPTNRKYQAVHLQYQSDILLKIPVRAVP